jgi:hypothetical protein
LPRSNVCSTRDLENPSASVHLKRFSTPSLTLKFLCAGKLNPRLPCLPAMRCLDKQSCARLCDYTDGLLNSLQDQRISSPRPSRAVLFSEGLWCIAANDAKPFHNPLLAKYLSRCYLADVKSAVDESYVGYTSAYSELAVQYFAHCDLLLHGVGHFALPSFTFIIAKRNSRLVPFAGQKRRGPGTLFSRLVESSRILR